jgi:CRISPR system Cascade subunit CasC
MQIVPGTEVADPDQDVAEWIVARLEALSLLEDQGSKKRYKDIQKAANRQEKEQLKDAEPDKPKDYENFLDKLTVPLKACPVDIALFGRMTTSDAFEDVEACLEVAHAMSTNEMVREVDYFTAVDDLGKGAAAAHVGENQFTSCTYYKYFSLDWKSFTERLAGPSPTAAARKSAAELARKALRALIHAAVHAVPTGKKKGNAHNNLPEAVLVEIKEKRIPTSYANAFLKPVVAPADGDLLTESVRRLGHYAWRVAEGYTLNPQRFWFDLHQEPLAFVPKAGENQPPKAKALAESCASFDALLDAVIAALPSEGSEG